MTVKTEAELNTDFADGFRTITASQLRDFVDSKFSIGGIMSCQDVLSAAITTSYAAFTFFTNSTDTKGVNEDLAQGLYNVQAGADGSYVVDVSMGIVANFNGWVQIAIVKNSSNLIFGQRRKRTFALNDAGSLDIVGGTQLAAGDTIGLAIRSNVSGTINIEDATFRIGRI